MTLAPAHPYCLICGRTITCAHRNTRLATLDWMCALPEDAAEKLVVWICHPCCSTVFDRAYAITEPAEVAT